MDLADRIARSEFAAVARVADVVDDLDGARVVADGRAPDLPRYNHAALVRTTPDAADRLVEKVAAFFRKRNRTPSIVLDPAAEPADMPQRLADAGWAPVQTQDLLLWNPETPHIFTEPRVYLTLCTNAALDRWLEIATGDLEGPAREQAAKMLALEFRTPGTWFWSAQYEGVTAAACAMTIVDGVGQVGPARTDPAYRGKGCGLAIVNFCTRQSRKDGAEVTFGLNDPGGPATGICSTAGYHLAGARQLWQLQS
jgi:GNAT superfamily N-acetyltransferase